MESLIHLDKVYFFRFPWLNGSQSVMFHELGIEEEKIKKLSLAKVVSLLFTNLDGLKDRILTFFDIIADSREEITTPLDDLTNLAMYPILQIIVQIIGNRIIGNAMRNTYAKSCYDQLQRQIKKIEFRNNTRKYNGFLVNICENLGFTCEHIRNKREGMINNIYFPFRMHFSNYLDVSSQFKDDNWKLINKYFGNGQVYLYQNDIEMLIREYVRMKTKPDYDKLPDPVIEDLRQVKEIAEIEEYVHEIIINRENRFQSSLIADDEVISRELFAPCIKAILYKLNHGENLGHNERLAIAFYYLNTNHSIEETVDLFRTSPDFDEGVARYQVEFAAGKRGKGTKYGMYGCSKMKSNRMCYANHPQFGDKLCVEGAFKRDGTNVSIHNPAGDYIFWKKVQLKRLHAAQRQAGEKIVEKEYEEKNQKNGNSKETKNYKNNKDKSNKANKSNRSIKKNHKNQRGKCGNTQERKIKKSGQNQKQKPGKNQGQKEGY